MVINSGLIQKLGRLGFCVSTPFIHTCVHSQLTNLQAHTVKQLAVVVIVIVVVYNKKKKRGINPLYYSMSGGANSSTSKVAPVATEMFQ